MTKQIELLSEKEKELARTIKDMTEVQSKVIQERDQFRTDTAELYKSKKVIEKSYNFDKISNKERETKLNKQLAAVTKENNDHMEEIITL